MLVGFAAGGSSDVMARTIAEHLGKRLGQAIVVENRAGAGGIIAAEAVAKSPSDGYTLLFGVPGPMVISQAMGQRLPFDPTADFAPVGLAGNLPLAMVVPVSFPADNLTQVLALAKSQPGGLNYAHTGRGSTSHIGMEILKTAAGVNIVGVPYKGQAAAMPDVVSGKVHMMLDGWATTLPLVRSNRLKFIAVTTANRSAIQPQVPTVAESGFPAFDVSPWYAVWAPAGTPRDIVNRVSAELLSVTQSAAIRERFAELGMDPLSADAGKFTAFLRQEQARWARAVRESGIKAE